MYEPGDQTLYSQPPGERGDQRDPGVGDHPIVIKHDADTVQSDRLVILHHQGDLLTLGPGCRHSLKKPCSGSGGHLRFTCGRKTSALRGGFSLNASRTPISWRRRGRLLTYPP